jgi:hypothetical protein
MVLRGFKTKERVMGLEPTNGNLGSYCLTTWLHPRVEKIIAFTSTGVKKLNTENALSLAV